MKKKYIRYLIFLIGASLVCLFFYTALFKNEKLNQIIPVRISRLIRHVQLGTSNGSIDTKQCIKDVEEDIAIFGKDIGSEYLTMDSRLEELEKQNSNTITPQMFGAIGNGIEDDTAAMQKAIDSLPEGGTLRIPPGKYKCNINIVKSNITIIGERGHHLEGSYLKPADLTKPCIQIGNGSEPVRNIKLENITLLGTNNTKHKESVGLKIDGAYYLFFNDLDIERFGSHNIEVTSGTQYTCYIYFNNLRSKQSHKSCIYVDYGKSFVTAFYVNNFAYEIGGGDNSRCITLKGEVAISCSNGWIEAKNYKGIELYDASSMNLINVSIDSGSSEDVLVKQFDQKVSRVYGFFSLDGKIENSMGIKMTSHGKGYFPNHTTLRDPIVQGSIFLVDKYNTNSEEDYNPTYDNRVELKGGKIYFSVDGKQFYFDSDTGQLKNFATHGGTTQKRPSNPIKYQQYYDINLKKLIIYDGSDWRDTLGNIE